MMNYQKRNYQKQKLFDKIPMVRYYYYNQKDNKFTAIPSNTNQNETKLEIQDRPIYTNIIEVGKQSVKNRS